MSESTVMIGKPERKHKLQEILDKFVVEYKWIENNREHLINNYLEHYIAVYNKKVHFSGKTMTEIIQKIIGENEDVRKYVIDFVSEKELSSLF